jgi:hippurate hydrolase
MDALPMAETTGLPYASATPGLMHACGHDGHTAMLLGAARYLAETRAFAGTAVLVFQPAEEGGAGAKAMLDDGLFDRFPVDEVYGMHNMPGLPVGQFAMRSGPLMAATDRFTITLEGVGGHAARPHMCVDPLVAGATLVTALQTIASRNADPIDSVVVSVTQFHAGSAFNIIPQTAMLNGTIRSLTEAMRTLARGRLQALAEGVGAAMGVRVTVCLEEGYPVTVNHDGPTALAGGVAAAVAGVDKVDSDTPPVMGAEDFSYMLQAKPGAFVFIGNGGGPGLHNPAYDFNDECIPLGMHYWTELVERALPLAGAATP